MNELCPHTQIRKQPAVNIGSEVHNVYTHYPDVIVETAKFINTDVPQILESAQVQMFQKIRNPNWELGSLEDQWKAAICGLIMDDIEAKTISTEAEVKEFKETRAKLSDIQFFDELKMNMRNGINPWQIDIPIGWQVTVSEGAIVNLFPCKIKSGVMRIVQEKEKGAKSIKLVNREYYLSLLEKIMPDEIFDSTKKPTIHCTGQGVTKHACLSAMLNYGLVVLNKDDYISSIEEDGLRKPTHKMLAEFKTIVSS